MEKKIFIVKNLTESQMNDLLSRLDVLTLTSSEIYLDFSKMYKVRSLGMLLFINFIDSKRKQGIVFFKTDGKNDRGYSYAKHCGFFYYLSFDDNYISSRNTPYFFPITSISYGDLYKFGDVHTGIVSESEKLARILSGDLNKDVLQILSYVLRELIRNTFEHTAAHRVLISAQCHSSEKKIEFVISDSGEGIRQVLSVNKDLEINSNSEALENAVKPGVSGNGFNRQSQKIDDVWENSGFGLYVTSEILNLLGSFTIISSNARLIKIDDRVITSKFACIGTSIRLEINIDKLKTIDKDIISSVVAKGESESVFIKGAVKTASRASKLINLKL